ncbi:hypothetical protein ACS0TY_011689 [Phlomoides rotata]
MIRKMDEPNPLLSGRRNSACGQDRSSPTSSLITLLHHIRRPTIQKRIQDVTLTLLNRRGVQVCTSRNTRRHVWQSYYRTCVSPKKFYIRATSGLH